MARSRGLVWAMEELEEQEAAANAVVEEPLAVDSLETDILEVNEDAGEIDDLNASIEEAVEDVDTLEDIASVMDESTENGGMDQTTARVAEIAVESIYKRLGVQKKSMPAMESFGSKGTRVGATKIAVEKIGEVLKEVWARIYAAGVKVFNWVKDFILNCINSAGKLKDRAIALAAKVKGLVGKKPEEAEVSLGSTGEAVAIDGKADASALSEGLKNLLELAEGIEKNNETMSKEMVEQNFLKAVQDETSLNNLKATHDTLVAFNNNDKADEDGNVSLTTKPLPGNVEIEVTVPKIGTVGHAYIDALSKQKISKKKGKRKGVATESNSEDGIRITTATPEQLIEVCEKVSALAKIVEASKSAAAKISSASSSFLSIIKNIGTKIAEVAKDVAGSFQRACSAISRNVSSFISTILSTIMNSGKSCLDWVEKHYAAYKAKKSEKVEAAAA